MNYRTNEFNQQIKSISQYIFQIETILSLNENNFDSTHQLEINSLNFKISSIFFKNKNQTIVSLLELQNIFSQLEKFLENSKDFPSKKFGESIKTKNFVDTIQIKKNLVQSIFL